MVHIQERVAPQEEEKGHPKGQAKASQEEKKPTMVITSTLERVSS
jgi:hypothetical protein